jgi:hypothetical protein
LIHCLHGIRDLLGLSAKLGSFLVSFGRFPGFCLHSFDPHLLLELSEVIQYFIMGISLHLQPYCVKVVEGELHLLMIPLSQDFPPMEVASASLLNDVDH